MDELTLQDFLEFNIDWLEDAVRSVKAGGDLAPQLSFFDRDGNLCMALLNLTNDKELEMQLARGLLKAQGARMYALISAVWVIRLDGLEPGNAERMNALIDKHGTGHPEVEHLRQEMYFVTVGDRNGSLFACFAVERDYKGKIRHLHRQPNPSPHAMVSGRMADLLAEPRH
jgi:hypothetical protein